MTDMSHWRTSISKIKNDTDDEDTIIRGHRLGKLIGRTSFAEMMFLLIRGELPTLGQARVLDALLTASMEHGLTPPAMIARTCASNGTSAQAAIAAGGLLFGNVMGGAGEALARMMVERVIAGAEARGRSAVALNDDDLRDVARKMVVESIGHGGRVPGFGIPVHRKDPRTPALLQVARETGVFGTYCRLLVMLEEELERVKGRPIAANLDGAGAAIVLDLGFPWQSAVACVTIPRSVSMLAHYLEESSQGTRWRHVPQEQVMYTGPMPHE